MSQPDPLSLACVFLNKRFNTSKNRDRFGLWLSDHNIDIVFAQDPWPTSPTSPTSFANFVPVGGNRHIFTWANSNYPLLQADQPEDFCQRIELGNLIVYNVYINAYSNEQRADQLVLLRQHVLSASEKNILIVGNFNIAPDPGDGLIAGKISTFNNHKDRGALQDLIQACDLLDLGLTTQSPAWTLERQRSIGKIQFRCDLALISRAIAPRTTCTTDHTTRKGQKAFTDHSALLITPQTLTSP